MLKKLILTAAIVGLAAYTQAQGLINFNNRVAGVAAPIFDTDGVTKLLGTAFSAQLYVYAGTTTADSLLTAVGSPVTFGTTTSASGYVLTSGAGIDPAVNVGAPGIYTVQVRAWAGPATSYETAFNVTECGKSNLIQVNAAASPTPTPNLTGLQSFSLTAVPEPSTIALGVMGLSVLLFRRRK